MTEHPTRACSSASPCTRSASPCQGRLRHAVDRSLCLMIEERSNGIQHELRGRCNKAAIKQVVTPEPHDHDLSKPLRTHVRVGVATRRLKSDKFSTGSRRLTHRCWILSWEIFGTSTSFLGNLVHGDDDDLLLCALPDRFLPPRSVLFFFPGVRVDSSSELFSVWLDGLRGAAAALPFLTQTAKKSGRELP